MNYESLKILDEMLTIISSAEDSISEDNFSQQFYSKYPGLKFGLTTLLSKLHQDGYILTWYDEGALPTYNPYTNEEGYPKYYSITLDGDVFLEQGGYFGKLAKEESKLKKERSDIEINNTLQVIVAATGALAGLYSILEIIKFNNGFMLLLVGTFSFLILSILNLTKKYKLTLLTSIMIWVGIVSACATLLKVIEPKIATPDYQVISTVRDSLNKVSKRLTGTDFCTLQTLDAINSEEAALQAQITYPFDGVNTEIGKKRFFLEEKIYKRLSDSTKKTNHWPDTTLKWIKNNIGKLDTPCYKLRDSKNLFDKYRGTKQHDPTIPPKMPRGFIPGIIKPI